MSQQIRANRRADEQRAPKPLDAALASAIQEIGALIEATSDTADLQRASRVIQKLARIAALKANARQYRIAGSVTQATQHEQAIERLYAELPAEVKW